MVSTKIIVDRETGRSKGYGFVLYTEPLGAFWDCFASLLVVGGGWLGGGLGLCFGGWRLGGGLARGLFCAFPALAVSMDGWMDGMDG